MEALVVKPRKILDVKYPSHKDIQYVYGIGCDGSLLLLRPDQNGRKILLSSGKENNDYKTVKITYELQIIKNKDKNTVTIQASEKLFHKVFLTPDNNILLIHYDISSGSMVTSKTYFYYYDMNGNFLREYVCDKFLDEIYVDSNCNIWSTFIVWEEDGWNNHHFVLQKINVKSGRVELEKHLHDGKNYSVLRALNINKNDEPSLFYINKQDYEFIEFSGNKFNNVEFDEHWCDQCRGLLLGENIRACILSDKERMGEIFVLINPEKCYDRMKFCYIYNRKNNPLLLFKFLCYGDILIMVTDKAIYEFKLGVDQ